MSTFFEVIKGIFFVITISVGLFYLRGSVVIETGLYNTLSDMIMPGYIVFCGIMMGYVGATIFSNNTDQSYIDSIYTRGFVRGLALGVVLAILYIYL